MQFMQWDKIKCTTSGFDQENSAPDNAIDTQSTGVPEIRI